MFINIIYEVISIMSDKRNFKNPFRFIKSKCKLINIRKKYIKYINTIDSFSYDDILSFCNFVSEVNNYIYLTKGTNYNIPIKYLSICKSSDYFHVKIYENIYIKNVKNNYIYISIPIKAEENNTFELKICNEEKSYSLIVYNKITPENLWGKIKFFNINVDVFKIFNNYKNNIEFIYIKYLNSIIKGGKFK